MSMYIINQVVIEHGHDYRLSKLYLPEAIQKFSFVLEDPERGYGIKVPEFTALPRGVYSVIDTYSNRFRRYTLQLYTHREDLSCRHGGIIYTGIRNHGGNTPADTAGCLITANNHYGGGRVGSRSDQILRTRILPYLMRSIPVKWIIS